MSTYNTQLQSNNTDLQQVLQNLQSTSASIGNEVDTQADLIAQIQSAVDNLPEASNSAVGTWTGDIELHTPLGEVMPNVYYTDNNFNCCVIKELGEHQINILPNTPIFLSVQYSAVCFNVTEITTEHDYQYYNCSVFLPTADNFKILPL